VENKEACWTTCEECKGRGKKAKGGVRKCDFDTNAI